MANEVPRLHRLCEALRAGLPDAHFRFMLKVRIYVITTRIKKSPLRENS
jgi:hypothetical protein